MRILLFCIVSLFYLVPANGQGFAYGIKGGMTLGVQKWDNSIQRDPLFRYHGIAFVESASEENEFGIFGQLGYHIRGSAIRTNAFVGNVNGVFTEFPGRTTAFEFQNISLSFGGKKKYDFAQSSKAYYLLGIRGEFTLGTNLDEFEQINNSFPGFYPVDGGVRNFNYGVTVGGGLEFPIGEYISGLLEFTVNPDFSKQYESPQVPNVSIPSQPGQTRTIPERNIINNSFELSLGIRFLRLVEYID